MNPIGTALVCTGLVIAIAVYGAVLSDHPRFALTDTPTGNTQPVIRHWSK